MTTKPFDPTKPVQTHSGLPARILCTDRAPSKHEEIRPILALIKSGSAEYASVFRSDGKKYGHRDDPWDLVNIPEKHKRWINIYENNRTDRRTFSTHKQAIINQDSDCIATICIEFTEGEGLD